MPHVPSSTRPRIRVGLAEVDCLTLSQTVARVCDLGARQSTREFVVTPNIHHISELRKSSQFRDAYADAALVLPDGFPVMLAMRALGARGQKRIAGSDLVPAVCRAAATKGLSVGFLGGQRGAAAGAARRLEEAHPGLRVDIVEPAPPGFDHDEASLTGVLGHVAAADPDILFIGLGAPKQELFAHANRGRLGSGVALCVGAGIDFAAGVARRCPLVLQRVGLEWAWRLLNDPRRLAGRYATAAPAFLGAVTPSIFRELHARIRQPKVVRNESR
jgi:N-acetylglucosaminyldiphosphoundecaprenol N-acetyl-beta-D-mannosaminyltransferase